MYVPRFQNLKGSDREYKRGFAYELYMYPAAIGPEDIINLVWVEWKDSLSGAGEWSVDMGELMVSASQFLKIMLF